MKRLFLPETRRQATQQHDFAFLLSVGLCQSGHGRIGGTEGSPTPKKKRARYKPKYEPYDVATHYKKEVRRAWETTHERTNLFQR